MWASLDIMCAVLIKSIGISSVNKKYLRLPYVSAGVPTKQMQLPRPLDSTAATATIQPWPGNFENCKYISCILHKENVLSDYLG